MRRGPMFDEFKKFLLQTNALALAVGVIIGAAIGKVVSSLVGDVLMPLIGILIPGGSWRDLKLVLTRHPDGSPANAISYGAFIGNIVDFVIISFIVFLITKLMLQALPKPPSPPTKECPQCKESIPAAAVRCRACTSPL